MKPTVSYTHTSNYKNLKANVKKLGERAVYVGIPSTTFSDRKGHLTKMANETKNQSRKSKLASAAASTSLNNAQLLYIFSKGSLITNQPPRPVLESAIIASGNKEAIAHELAQATKASLEGNAKEANSHLKRAGIAASNASKKWFTDPRNGWPANALRTVMAKGSNRPGIDTASMQQAITYVVKDEG